MSAQADKLFREQTLELKKGDVIMLYTDGIPEAWRSKKEIGIRYCLSSA